MLEEYCPIIVSEFFTVRGAREKIRIYNYESSKPIQNTPYIPRLGQISSFRPPSPFWTFSGEMGEDKPNGVEP